MKVILASVLKTRKLSTFLWCLGPSLYILLVTSVYQSYLSAHNNSLSKSLQQLPATVRSFISIKGDFTTPVGFLGSEPYYVLLPIVLIILAIALGSSLLAREEENHTLELLLARPVSRGRLLLGKAGGGILILLIVNIVALLVMILCTSVFHIDIAIKALLLTHVMLFLLSLMFGALAFTLTAIGFRARRASIGLSALLALGGYVLASLENNVSWLRWPAKLLPYHYYNPTQNLRGHFDWHVALVFLAITAILALASWLAFRRRDIE